MEIIKEMQEFFISFSLIGDKEYIVQSSKKKQHPTGTFKSTIRYIPKDKKKYMGTTYNYEDIVGAFEYFKKITKYDVNFKINFKKV